VPYFDAPGVRLDGSATVASHGRNDQVLDAAAGNPTVYARLTANRSESGDYADAPPPHSTVCGPLTMVSRS
jgi:iron complex outermembrane receptor protein